jgi:thiosulfate sulfurtransferase
VEPIRISAEDALKLIDDGDLAIVDIRDEQSYQQAHIPEAFHLTNGSISQFMDATDFETPVIVCCYHGVSSISAAQYLLHQGFETVYSLDGGFEHWRKHYQFVSADQ